MAVPVLNPPKSILWVDDEGELLEPHRIFLRSKGYTVEWASNADDAVELLRRRPFDILLLDEQMPGKRGLEVYRDVREIAPTLPVVMVTKSEEDSTLKEAIGVNIRDYLVKPINPRQVLTVVTRILEGPRIRQQAIARSFVERFRAIELERDRNLDWRGWIDRYDELMRWDVDLAAAGEMGLYESLQGLYPDMHREFAAYMKDNYPEWLKNLEGNRPPLSIDIVAEFLLPILERDKAAVFIVVDCLRLDQWRVLEPLLAPFFDVETTHYFAVLPTATPYSRNSLFSGLFPGEIAARLPDWWGNADREDESLNAHERELLESHLEELCGKTPVRYQKISTAANSDELERHLGTAIGPEGRERVRVQLRRSAHPRTQRVADPVRSRARRDRAAPDHPPVVPAVGAVQRAEGSIAAEDLRAPHDRSRLDPLQHTSDGVRQARRERQSALQVRGRSAGGAPGAGPPVLERRHAAAAAARPGWQHAARDQ